MIWEGFVIRIVTIALFVASAGCYPAKAEGVMPPDAIVDGKSQAAWSTAWWQWAGSFQPDNSPIADPSGTRCHAGQSGKVWFLAGAYGSQRVNRTCTVPRGKYIFFPLINYAMVPMKENNDCSSMMERARRLAEHPIALVLEIDGDKVGSLERHRQASPECFDMAAKANSRVAIYPSAADGYWVMLKPLARGTHVINFGGILPSSIQAISYKLVVQ